MKWFILLASVSLIAYPVRAEYSARVRAYIEMSGTEFETPARVMMVRNSNSAEVRIVRWEYDALPRPTEAMLPTEQEAADFLAAKAAAAEIARQAAKPLERRFMENQFYQLTAAILVAAADPRAADPVIPKLGFPEIQAIVEVIQTADPMTAITFSLKLLSIDAALKRHDLMWWDDAAQHVID